jgi:hypothetical protein
MTFCVGDIVEVNFSIVVIPVKENKFQMMLVLRALALLDSSQTEIVNPAYHLCQLAGSGPMLRMAGTSPFFSQ